MAPFQTHLSLVQSTTAEHPSALAFKAARPGPAGTDWTDVSYATFQKDVETSAQYWAGELSKAGIQGRSVVAMWLKGLSYEDLVHMWGVSRAGFVPQLISLRMTDPSVTYELAIKAQAAALIHDVVFTPMLKSSPVPAFAAGNVLDTPGLEKLPLPPLQPSSDAEEVVMIYHTSGSTSGIPKLVPITVKWIDNVIYKMQLYTSALPSLSKQRVGVSVGSFSHMGNVIVLLESISQVGCFIVPSTLPYPVSELQYMIDQCGLTRLNIFSPFLSGVLRQARQDPSLLRGLQSLDSVAFSGLPLNAEDESWARSQGLNVANGFASTEMGMMMASKASPEAPYLEAWPGARFEMVPLKDASALEERLLELVIPPEFPECPHPSLRDPTDGKFYSGDLFTEVSPDQYISKGRNDDWIKMESSLRCDTSSIEANAMQTCRDLISSVVVVGAARPCPAMVAEMKGGDVDEASLKSEILERITPFHKRRYAHERIEDARLILVVPGGTLPRTATKGSVRRAAVEKLFKADLNRVYGELVSA
ncbi:hypothetical protein ACJZ2D_011763 [Fusarium nematophilum]